PMPESSVWDMRHAETCLTVPDAPSCRGRRRVIPSIFRPHAPRKSWRRAEVRNWAAKHRAQNPSDMGPNNFRRFLFDAGLPGGQAVALEWETDGTLKYK